MKLKGSVAIVVKQSSLVKGEKRTHIMLKEPTTPFWHVGGNCKRGDIPPEDLNKMLDLDGHQHPLNDLSCYLQPRPGTGSLSRSGRSKTLTPANLEELFSSEISSSPRYSDPAAAFVFSPTHKSIVLNQFQQINCSQSVKTGMV
ncbi:Zinc finger CCCH domain-containing protein [Vigna angularis]|uniref:Zinc finger CCCH domain-containing protein n=1 Tax=Phaseolus angularis TaxID=3914 RepID=A0A8T0K8P6_PHAAN|nr:Zinc finger CCCH domain-containing protein [Vigna angularis]